MTSSPQAHLAPADLAGLAVLDPSAPERALAEAHARTCPRCGPLLASASETLASLSALERPAAPPDLGAVRARVFAELAADARRIAQEGWVALAGAALVLGLAFAVLRIVGAGWMPALEAGVAATVAVVAALFARNTARARFAVGAVLASSLCLVALDVDGDPSAAVSHGAVCGGLVVSTAILPALVAAWLSVRAIEPGASWRVVARAGAAGLAAQGALAFLCGHHGALHLVPFHASSILAAMALAATLPTLWASLGARQAA